MLPLFMSVVLESFLYVICISFLGIAGDEFRNEAGKEELYSNYEGHKSQIEQRLICNCPEFESLCLGQ